MTSNEVKWYCIGFLMGVATTFLVMMTRIG